MTPNTPQEITPEEHAMVDVVTETPIHEVMEAYADQLRVADAPEPEKFNALANFAINALNRGASGVWQSIGPVGQSAMSKAVDALCVAKTTALDEAKGRWEKIRDRNKAQEEPPAADPALKRHVAEPPMLDGEPEAKLPPDPPKDDDLPNKEAE